MCCQKKDEISSSFEWDERKMWLKRRTHTGSSVNLLKTGKKMEWIFSARWLLDVLSQIINHYKRHFITWLFFNTSTCHAKSFPKSNVRSRNNTTATINCEMCDFWWCKKSWWCLFPFWCVNVACSEVFLNQLLNFKSL